MKNVKNIEKVTTETVTISREEYDKLIAQNLEMQKQIKWLMDTIKLKNNKIFGSSSEKSNKEESDQLSIFNEAEVESNLQVKEPELEEVKAHYRKKRTKKDRLPEDLPVEEVEYTLPEEEQICPVCDEELHVIGKETVREELKIIPAKAVIVRHVRFSYACRNCEKTNTEVPVVKAPVPNAVIKGGFASLKP